MFSNLFRLNKAVLAASASGIAVGSMVTIYKHFYQYQGGTRLDDWINEWKEYEKENKSPPWDQGKPNEATKYLNEMYSLEDVPKIRVPNQIRILRCFVPLCGDSRDMKSINDHFKNLVSKQDKELKTNYRIKLIGIEVAMSAIDKFFQRECDGSYSVDYDLFTKIPIYNENNYNIINSDLFNASMSRLVLAADCIYDHSSLSVIDPKYRSDYVSFCKNILSKKGKILLTTYNYQSDNKNIGPPYSMNKNEIFELYKDVLNGSNDTEKESNLVLLQSISMKESDDEWLKQQLDESNLENSSIDIWLIRGNASKSPSNENAIR